MSTTFSANNGRVLVTQDGVDRFDSAKNYPVVTYSSTQTTGLDQGEELDCYILRSGGSSAIQRVPPITRTYTYTLATRGFDYESTPDFVYGRARWSDVFGTNEAAFTGSILQVALPGVTGVSSKETGVAFAVQRDLYATNSAIVMRVKSVSAPVFSARTSGGGEIQGEILREFQDTAIRNRTSLAGYEDDGGATYEVRRYQYNIEFLEIYAGNLLGDN